MKKYVVKRDKSGLPERLTRYRQELNAEQFRVVTSPPKAALVVAGALALWFHYGTTVFFEMIASGISACF